LWLLAVLSMTIGLATPAFAWEQSWTAPPSSTWSPYETSSTSTHVTPIVWMLPILVLLFIYRRPAGAKPNGRNNSTASSDIASLSCSRCGRVLELPRDKASRQLFCPRCGSTLPRIR
jgi:hypothetical protein